MSCKPGMPASFFHDSVLNVLLNGPNKSQSDVARSYAELYGGWASTWKIEFLRSFRNVGCSMVRGIVTTLFGNSFRRFLHIIAHCNKLLLLPFFVNIAINITIKLQIIIGIHYMRIKWLWNFSLCLWLVVLTTLLNNGNFNPVIILIISDCVLCTKAMFDLLEQNLNSIASYNYYFANKLCK